MKKKWIVLGIVLMLMVGIFVVFYKGYINTIVAENYEIRGLDISHYQKEIDWKEVQHEDVDFIFMKATEGSGMVDSHFKDNWDSVNHIGILSAPYHFFSMDSPPETQAELFISTVGQSLSGHLPPVLDVEYYGDMRENKPDVKQTQENIQKMLSLLEEQYHVKPIIYSTYSFYQRYLSDEFEEYPLWIRNTYFSPFDKEWTFWQYTEKGRIQGCSEWVDKNVFEGDMKDLQAMIVE